MHGRAGFCPSNPRWRLANEHTQQTGLFPCVGAHNDNDPLTGIYHPRVYSPRSAYISFGRSAGGHDWRAVDEQFVTVKALKGELVVIRADEDRQANIYEWFWWAANFAALVEPGARLQQVTLVAWKLGITQHKLAIRVFCYSVLIGQYRFLPTYYDKCARCTICI